MWRFCALVLLCVSAIEPLRAEASPSEARASWARGKQLLAQKKGPEALEALEAAASKDPSAQIQLDLARALVLVGALEEAHVILEVLETDRENQLVAKAAQKLHRDVLTRLPTLTVLVGDDTVIISINGRSMDAGASKPLDPGRYDLEVRRDGEVIAKRKVTLVERERKTVDLSSARHDVVASTAMTTSGTYLPAVLAYVTSGVGLTLGAIVGVAAFDAAKEVELACGGTTCPNEFEGEITRANTLSHVSTASFVTGAVGLGLGLTFTFTLGPDDKPQPVEVGGYFAGPEAGIRITFE